MLLGISGPAGAGKDTIADMLVAEGFKRYAFADALRDAIWKLNPVLVTNWRFDESAVLDVKLEQTRVRDVVGRIGWDRAKREVDEVRRLLQNMGTEVGRDLFGENVWVDKVRHDWFEDMCPDAVITDMRFANEVDWVQYEGGFTLRVERQNNPNAIVTTHASEQYVPECTYTINNNGTLEELQSKVTQLLWDIKNDNY